MKSFRQITNEKKKLGERLIQAAKEGREIIKTEGYATNQNEKFFKELKKEKAQQKAADDAQQQEKWQKEFDRAAKKRAKKKKLSEAWGNIFSRNKESGHLVTGGQGGGGSSPYMRYGSGGGKVRLSQGSTSAGKQKLTTSLIQKLGGGNFMRSRQSFVFGGSSLKKSGLYKTPKFK